MPALLDRITRRPHTVFLWLSLLFGAAFIVLTPRFSVPDESLHFLRVLQLSRGSIFLPVYLPRSFIDSAEENDPHASPRRYADYLRMPLGERLRDIRDAATKDNPPDDPPVKLLHNRAVMYSPAPYLSALPAAWIAEALNLSPAAMLYLERIAIGVSATLLIYYAIYLTPVLKWPFFFLSLFPLTTYIRSGVSADPLTLGYAMMYIALILKSALPAHPVPLRQVYLMAFFSVLLCLSKTAYMSLPLFFMIIPGKCFSSRLHYLRACFITVVIPLLLGLLWIYAIHHCLDENAFPVIEHTQDAKEKLTGLHSWVDERGQMLFVLHHPLSFLTACWHTLQSKWFIYVAQFVGGIGPYPFVSLLPIEWELFSFMWLVFFSTAGAFPDGLSESIRLKSIVLFVLSWLSIDLLLYIFWNPVKAPVIEGIQVRYFTPVMPLLLVAICYPLRPGNLLLKMQVPVTLLLTVGMLCDALTKL